MKCGVIDEYNIDITKPNSVYECQQFTGICMSGERFRESTFRSCIFNNCRIVLSAGKELLNGKFTDCAFKGCIFQFCVNDTTTFERCGVVGGYIIYDEWRFANCVLNKVKVVGVPKL